VPRVGYPDPDTFLSTCARIGELLDALPDLVGASIDRTILGGFSQGAVMSYAMSLGAGRPAPASTVAMSGFIPAVEGFSLDLTARRGYRVAIAHGTHDPVISVDFARDARLRLQAAGLDVLYRESPMAHTIDPRVIPELEAFVSASLPGR
jgi:phospholipase/carboxylesterase